MKAKILSKYAIWHVARHTLDLINKMKINENKSFLTFI